MKLLEERILKDGIIKEGGIVKVDGFLNHQMDIKLINEDEHVKYTGISNVKILENIKFLFRHHTNVIFRVPLIPSVTDTRENLLGIANFVNTLSGPSKKRIELLKYNNLAENKYSAIDASFSNFGDPQTNDHIEALASELNSQFSDVTVFYKK